MTLKVGVDVQDGSSITGIEVINYDKRNRHGKRFSITLYFGKRERLAAFDNLVFLCWYYGLPVYDAISSLNEPENADAHVFGVNDSDPHIRKMHFELHHIKPVDTSPIPSHLHFGYHLKITAKGFLAFMAAIHKMSVDPDPYLTTDSVRKIVKVVLPKLSRREALRYACMLGMVDEVQTLLVEIRQDKDSRISDLTKQLSLFAVMRPDLVIKTFPEIAAIYDMTVTKLTSRPVVKMLAVLSACGVTLNESNSKGKTAANILQSRCANDAMKKIKANLILGPAIFGNKKSDASLPISPSLNASM